MRWPRAFAARPCPRRRQPAAAQRAGRAATQIALFLLLAVPVVGSVLSAMLGRKLGAAGHRPRCRRARLVAHREPVLAGLGALAGAGAGRPRHRRRRSLRAAAAAARSSGAAAAGGGWGGGGRRGRLLVGRRRRLRRRWRLGALVSEASMNRLTATAASTAGSTRATHGARSAPARSRLEARVARASGATAARSASASRPGCRCPTCGATPARASGRSRCSASCASGTPSTTTAC